MVHFPSNGLANADHSVLTEHLQIAKNKHYSSTNLLNEIIKLCHRFDNCLSIITEQFKRKKIHFTLFSIPPVTATARDEELHQKHQYLQLLVEDGHTYFYCGYLSQIGNHMHSLKHSYADVYQQFIHIKKGDHLRLNELVNSDILLDDKKSLSQILHACLQLRNLRGHEFEFNMILPLYLINQSTYVDNLNGVMIDNLMRGLVNKLSSFIDLVTSISIAELVTEKNIPVRRTVSLQ